LGHLCQFVGWKYFGGKPWQSASMHEFLGFNLTSCFSCYRFWRGTIFDRLCSDVSFCNKTAFFNDVTITSSLRSVVQVLMIEHFTIFQSHVLSGWFVPKIVKSYLNLLKLRLKYYQSLFSGHGVYVFTLLLNWDQL